MVREADQLVNHPKGGSVGCSVCIFQDISGASTGSSKFIIYYGLITWCVLYCTLGDNRFLTIDHKFWYIPSRILFHT